MYIDKKRKKIIYGKLPNVLKIVKKKSVWTVNCPIVDDIKYLAVSACIFSNICHFHWITTMYLNLSRNTCTLATKYDP